MLTRLLERLGLKATAPVPLTPAEFMRVTSTRYSQMPQVRVPAYLAQCLDQYAAQEIQRAPRAFPPLSERERHYLSIHIHNTSASRSALK